MKIRIKYRTVSGRVEEIVVEAASASGALVQAQNMEREMIKETIFVKEEK